MRLAVRNLTVALIVGLCLTAASACGGSKAPQGRWEGTYESPEITIAARLEIDGNGAIYVSAPNTLIAAAASEDERAAIRQRLAQELAGDWGSVEPRRMEFDGKVFRKPGGVAPQLEWNPDTKRMTMIVYPGTQPSVRLGLHAVREFSDDPWPG